MALQQQVPELLRDHVAGVIVVGVLVVFGVLMVYLGWLRYRKLKEPTKSESANRPGPEADR